MFLVTQAPNGALSTRRYTLSSHPQFPTPNPPLFSKSKSKSKFISRNPKRSPKLTVSANADSNSSTKPTFSTTSTTPPPPSSSTSYSSFNNDETVFVGEERVPLEGVIQFDKPNISAKLNKWGRVGLLAGGDVLALLVFSAIGRFSHGFPVFDVETLHTADPFIAGWFLSAYFLGGYADDGRGMNGMSKGVTAAAKSWAVGIPVGIGIRAATSGHIPSASFMAVAMGSTAVLLIGWRALLYTVLPNDQSKKNDVYKRGSPFELFELLTSLVRRW